LGFPDAASEAPAEFDQEIVNSAINPLLSMPKSFTRSRLIQGCSSVPRYEGSRKSAPIGPVQTTMFVSLSVPTENVMAVE